MNCKVNYDLKELDYQIEFSKTQLGFKQSEANQLKTDLRVSIEKFKDLLKKLDKSKKECETQIERTQKEIEKLKSTIISLEKKIVEINKTIDELKKEIEKVEIARLAALEAGTLKQKDTQQSESQANTNQTNSGTTANNSSNTSTETQKNDDSEPIEAQLDEKRPDYDAILENLKEILKNLIKHKKAILNHMKELKTFISKCNEIIIDLKFKRDNLNNCIKAVESMIKYCEESIVGLEALVETIFIDSRELDSIKTDAHFIFDEIRNVKYTRSHPVKFLENRYIQTFECQGSSFGNDYDVFINVFGKHIQEMLTDVSRYEKFINSITTWDDANRDKVNKHLKIIKQMLNEHVIASLDISRQNLIRLNELYSAYLLLANSKGKGLWASSELTTKGKQLQKTKEDNLNKLNKIELYYANSIPDQETQTLYKNQMKL